MKKLILIISILTLWIPSNAQQVQPDSVADSDQCYVYCEIVGVARFMSQKVTVELDFGEAMNYWGDSRIRDPKTGKPVVFNSMIDALNFMGKRGWEFVQAYAVTAGNQNVYHYLLKKPSESDKIERKEHLINKQ